MLYKYFFSITTAKKIDDLKDSYENEIISAVKNFNRSSQYARTYKKILEDSVKIYNDRFEFVLQTKESLGDNLSLRHLHLLSKNLLEINGLNQYTENKRYLKPLEIKGLQDEKLQNENLTDNQILKHIIDLYFDNSNSMRSKSIKRQIKELITEYIK